MSRRNAFALLITVALVGCSGAEAPPRSPYIVFPGDWGGAGSDDCDTEPETIRFSDDHKLMVLEHAPVRPDGIREARSQVVYQVVEELPDGLRLSTEAGRADTGGDAATWELTIVDRHELCWHRGARQATCRKTLLRCKH